MYSCMQSSSQQQKYYPKIMLMSASERLEKGNIVIHADIQVMSTDGVDMLK